MAEAGSDTPPASPLQKAPLRHRDLAHLTFYAVDSEDTHNLYLDPDDAFVMEKLPDGTMLLHVAVVDSTVIPIGSPGDRRAADRGTSLYHPSYVPMLQKNWYEDIGLWEGRRNAIVTTVHLSRKGKVKGTWFTRQEIDVKSLTHRQAGELMDHEGHPLEVMATAMKKLQKIREKRTKRVHVDYDTGLEVGLEGNVSAFMPDMPGMRAVHNLIQESMILANSAVANWANESGLPFIYRNHGSEVPNFDIVAQQSALKFDVRNLSHEDKQKRDKTRKKVEDFIHIKAQYNAHCHGHVGIGIKSYAHTTSPLRRYVDILNQKMMGFTMGVMDRAEAMLAEQCPDATTTRIRKVLWKQGPHIIEPIYDYLTAAPKERKKARSNGMAEVEEALKTCLAELKHPEQNIKKSFVAELLSEKGNPLPYRRSDLEQLAEYTNRILEIPQAEKKRMSLERINSWLRRLMSNPDPEILRDVQFDFTDIVKRAATTGQINSLLFDEIVYRIDETHKLKKYRDRDLRLISAYAAILALAPYDEEYKYGGSEVNGKSYWKKLKQMALDELKFDAGSVDDVIQNIQDAKLLGEHFSVVMENKDMRDANGQTIHTSLCVVKMKDKDDKSVVLAPPSYVVMPEGHAALAKANARYQFLEALAHKSLVPIDEVAMPDTMSASIRRVVYPLDLLVEIANRHGIDYKISQTEWKTGRRADDPPEEAPQHGFTAVIELSGAKMGELIDKNPARAPKYRERQALWCSKKSQISLEDATTRAARNLLGKPEIESLMPSDIIVDYTTPEDPLKALHNAEQEGSINFKFQSQRDNGTTHQRIYDVSLVVTRPGNQDEVLYGEKITSPDEHHARFQLAQNALRHLREQGFLRIGGKDTAPSLGQLSFEGTLQAPGNLVNPGQNIHPPERGRRLT